jgi:uncharacterized membrane protein YeaQ/YmgE (transglycosylase-associated protein family)
MPRGASEASVSKDRGAPVAAFSILGADLKLRPLARCHKQDQSQRSLIMEGVGWIGAIIIGGIAGWLAEQFMKSNLGLLMNIVLGIVGAAVASTLFAIIGIQFAGWIGYLIAGFIGACILIAIGRAIRG